jgi:hypothetical protein
MDRSRAATACLLLEHDRRGDALADHAIAVDGHTEFLRVRHEIQSR